MSYRVTGNGLNQLLNGNSTNYAAVNGVYVPNDIVVSRETSEPETLRITGSGLDVSNASGTITCGNTMPTADIKFEHTLLATLYISGNYVNGNNYVTYNGVPYTSAGVYSVPRGGQLIAYLNEYMYNFIGYGGSIVQQGVKGAVSYAVNIPVGNTTICVTITSATVSTRACAITHGTNSVVTVSCYQKEYRNSSNKYGAIHAVNTSASPSSGSWYDSFDIAVTGMSVYMIAGSALYMRHQSNQSGTNHIYVNGASMAAALTIHPYANVILATYAVTYSEISCSSYN